jgi:hypothetical protein
MFPIDIAIGRNDNGDLTVTVKVVVGGFQPVPIGPVPDTAPR